MACLNVAACNEILDDFQSKKYVGNINAHVAELADALDSGSSP